MTYRISNGSTGSASAAASRQARSFIVTGSGQIETPPPLFGGGGNNETPIGADDRKQVAETDLTPWRKICSLRLAHPSRKLWGTGFFVGPKTIITAGHCVHYKPFFAGGSPTSIEVSPGRDGADFLPFGTVTATRYSTLPKWIESNDPDYDVGCIHLEEPLGDQTGWFPLACLDDEALRDRQVNVSGYPAKKGGGIVQYFHANSVLGITDQRVFYDVDTGGGQSGSPVWVQDGSDPRVVAVHAYGTRQTPPMMGITANSAPRITADLFDTIMDWIKEDGGLGPIWNPNIS